ncbi:hypothetical protein G6F37_006579 [Rhizopus arrhizus]|nr:hypothetical protein G6F37_006579 [Rhizopus arrhizus]
MDEMNKYPEIKDHYLIMELNPIEQFWSILESAIKREFVLKKDSIPAKVKESIKSIPQPALDRFAHYSVERFDGCLLERPI